MWDVSSTNAVAEGLFSTAAEMLPPPQQSPFTTRTHPTAQPNSNWV